MFLFENDVIRTEHTRYFLPTVEIKDCNVMNEGKNSFYQPINDNTKIYENIRKIATDQEDDYTRRLHNKTGCLLDYPYFKENHKMIAIDLSRQQALDIDPRSIQKINFTGNLVFAGDTAMFDIIEEAKEAFYKEL